MLMFLLLATAVVIFNSWSRHAILYARFETLKGVRMKITVLWEMMACRPTHVY